MEESEYKFMDKVFGYDGDEVPVAGRVSTVSFGGYVYGVHAGNGSFSYGVTQSHNPFEIESTDDIESWYDVDIICKIQSFPETPLFVNVNDELIYVNWYDQFYELLLEKLLYEDENEEFIDFYPAYKLKNGKWKTGTLEKIIYSIKSSIDYITIKTFKKEEEARSFVKEANKPTGKLHN